MSADYKMKMIQLDLARQPETLDTIKNELKRFHDSGYNTVLLYLEDLVRTECYPYPKEYECYTPDQIREMIRYADSLNLELIPGLELLGHMEHFLKHEELAFLNECREDGWGRFGKNRNTLCLANEKAVNFILNYVKEAAQIFPSKYVHAGLDETFDFCSCPDCQKLAEELGGAGKLFLRHIKAIVNELASCGKEMIMWSDMLEFYPEIIPEIPRSVIMVDWQYDKDVCEYKGHFSDRERNPFPQMWQHYGFRFITAPRELNLSNFITCLSASAKYHPFGALVTSWEHGGHYLPRTAPVTSADGFLMNGATVDEAIESMISQLFGEADPIFKSALRTLCFDSNMQENGLWEGKLLTIHDTGAPFGEWEAQRLVLDIFRTQEKKYAGNTVFQNLLNTLEGRAASNRIQGAVEASLLNGFTPERKAEYESAVADYLSSLNEKASWWNKFRPGYPGKLDSIIQSEKDLFMKIKSKLEAGAWLVVRYCLPDQYGRPETRFEFTANGTTRLISKCVAKSSTDFDCIFERWYPADPEFVPEKIRLSYAGYGGTGVCHFKYVNHNCIMVPDKIVSTDGIIEHPEHLLINDEKFCWLGTQDTKSVWENRAAAGTSAVIEVTMKQFLPEI